MELVIAVILVIILFVKINSDKEAKGALAKDSMKNSGKYLNGKQE